VHEKLTNGSNTLAIDGPAVNNSLITTSLSAILLQHTVP